MIASNLPRHVRVLIVGGGTAGISVAARLRRSMRPYDVAIVEPSTKHYYQPLWTLVGGGVFDKRRSEQDEARLIPRGAQWLRQRVAEFRPEQNCIVTDQGEVIRYDYLVVALGIQLNWDHIAGLRAALGHNGVCSNYSYQTVDYTWQCIRKFTGGTALFTMPATAVKCGGAPQKIMYLADDYFRRSGVRNQSQVLFATAQGSLFAIEKYRRTLEQVVQRKQIDVRFKHNLVEIQADQKIAHFEQVDTGERVAIPYDMIHVTPPMSAPDVIQSSPLANSAGWVEVDPATLQHTRFANVFSLGDCAGLPTSKTGAAIRKQAPVVVSNLLAAMAGQPLVGSYDGYTSCPIVTGYGKLVLAEFGYDGQPHETFPFDQSRERRSMYLLKKYLLPKLYWQGMLKGRA